MSNFMGMEKINKPRSEVAKRADTERFEVDRKTRNESVSESSNMSMEDLHSLRLLPNDPQAEIVDAIEGTVNGVKFEGHMDKGGLYSARLDGTWLPQADARQAYMHVRRAMEQRDSSNRVAVNGINNEIDYVEMYEPKISTVRDKFYGGSSPDHDGMSKAA
jgi:hypothetical protein